VLARGVVLVVTAEVTVLLTVMVTGMQPGLVKVSRCVPARTRKFMSGVVPTILPSTATSLHGMLCSCSMPIGR